MICRTVAVVVAVVVVVAAVVVDAVAVAVAVEEEQIPAASWMEAPRVSLDLGLDWKDQPGLRKVWYCGGNYLLLAEVLMPMPMLMTVTVPLMMNHHAAF